MRYKIVLEVLGVDLQDDATADIVSRRLDVLTWRAVGGRTLATLFVDTEPVSAAVWAARAIEQHLSGAVVRGADEQLVSVSDISARLSVSRETVRSWVVGARGPGGFPVPRGSVGGGDRGSTKVWDWPSVNAWLQEQYSLGDGYRYLTATQLANVNARVHRLHVINTEELVRAYRSEFIRAFTATFEEWDVSLLRREPQPRGGFTSQGAWKTRSERPTHLRVVPSRRGAA